MRSVSLTSAEVLLVDTSVAIPLLDEAELAHEPVQRVVAGKVVGLAGHAAFETRPTRC